jgi:hypothetical protein
MMISSHPGFGVYGVTGSPFSADVDYEFTQVLAGENHIHRESHSKIFRDGQGRIRNETEPETPPGPSVMMATITINDPVSQTMITLYPPTKSALVDHMSRYRHAFGIGLPIDNSPAPGTGSPRSSEEMLQQLKALQRAKAAVPAATRQKAMRPGEDLGAKEIEGFTAWGIRSSDTTPAGKIGNEKPIVKVDEIWWCKDLQAVLVSIYDDPLYGRRTMRLTNIQVGEPDPRLFQIPSDYTVRDAAKPSQ